MKWFKFFKVGEAMLNKKDNIYFYTMIHKEKGIKSSDICYEFDYDESKNLFKTVLDGEEVSFKIDGEIIKEEDTISFNTLDSKIVKLKYLNLPLYESLKGYLISYNSPTLRSDREVQEYFKSQRNFK